jgi:hypothetical protein
MYKNLPKKLVIQTLETHWFTIGQKNSHYLMQNQNSKIPKSKNTNIQ